MIHVGFPSFFGWDPVRHTKRTYLGYLDPQVMATSGPNPFWLWLCTTAYRKAGGQFPHVSGPPCAVGDVAPVNVCVHVHINIYIQYIYIYLYVYIYIYPFCIYIYM